MELAGRLSFEALEGEEETEPQSTRTTQRKECGDESREKKIELQSTRRRRGNFTWDSLSVIKEKMTRKRIKPV